MKSTIFDKFVGFFSPELELKRVKARGKIEFLQRSYDAAQSFKTDDWRSATHGSANLEIRGAQSVLRAKGRDAIRNNPYASKALNTIVSNTVGHGIVPNIKGKSSLQTKRLQDAWKEWAETSLCDVTGLHNFYGLQSLALRSTVESGEILTIKEINSKGMQLRLLESDYIVSSKESSLLKATDDQLIQGVRVDKFGRVVSYILYKSHPGESRGNLEEVEISKDKICHVYKQDRPGQLRGVSWFHSVIRQMEDFNEFQQATLINRKVSACFTAFITKDASNETMASADLKAKREAEMQLSPASIMYLNPGEGVEMASPSPIQGYDEYCRQTLRAIAAGIGITYESLTGDYSQVNFSSGRMGHIEFRRNVEMWRWSMLIPQFCEPAFQHFLNWCQIYKGIPIEDVKCEWVCPAWSMIDPTKEIAAMSDAVRSGLMTYQKAILELGYDPEQHLTEIFENNKKLDELEILLDSDPRKLTKAGILQVDNSNQNKGNINEQNANQNDSVGSTSVDSSGTN
jgi:lambda family phage portal protein